MKRLRPFSWLKQFFFPPAGTPRWLRILPYAFMGVLSAIALYYGAQGWDYANSPQFCGTTCHTMPPEYSAYLVSPHARVLCSECHIGRDVLTEQFSRKAGDMRHVIDLVAVNYEYPIFAKEMRPARETCERCHFPEKFSDDSLRVISHRVSDEANTKEETTLIMKTGGGSEREGLGRGIHWHIENEVWYLATDPLDQEIPYVRTVDADGEIKEYYDVASGLTPDDVAGSTLERMDCITCHNRITHSMPDPGTAVDQAMEKKLIAGDLPFMKQEAVKLLSASYPNQETAMLELTALVDYYQENYPEIYVGRADEIQQAVDVLQDIYNQIVFPDQEVDWQTHPDNLGHIAAPGCFRCHDGKHLTSTEEAIRLECNICHSVPVVHDPNALVTNIEIIQGPEPTSHIHTSWIALHGQAIDISCAACHEPNDPTVDYTTLEGRPPSDGSFCGNSACHASEWTYIGLDAPEMDAILDRQLYLLLNTSPYLMDGEPRTYEGVFKAMFDGRCTFCHAGLEPKAGLDLSSYEMIMQGGNNGPVIIPGDPDASLLIEVQSTRKGHFGQVLDDELAALRDWIVTGAPGN